MKGQFLSKLTIRQMQAMLIRLGYKGGYYKTKKNCISVLMTFSYSNILKAFNELYRP